MIGARVGVTIGSRIGVAVGVSSDPLAPPAGGGGGIPGVTRDATNLNYYPANATEWTALMSAAGLATGNPSSVWPAQEPSGALADSIGAISLAVTGAAFAYQAAITGATRKGVKGTDGAVNSALLNNTTAPNPAATSTLQLAYLDVPAAPAAVRGIMSSTASGGLFRWNITGTMRIVSGATTDGAVSVASTRGWFAVRSNITASTVTVFSPAEKVVGTYALPGAGAFTNVGGANGAASPAAAIGYAYVCQFTGAAAELSDAQLKTLMQTLGGVVLW